ncbi:MAG TPA: sigma-70 family RNA polymerase sigma factor [Solirubrobacterales bacterium]|nr:sigma-70 family RNA polymerase sigma factor [Solirubrobacterales bacterium]
MLATSDRTASTPRVLGASGGIDAESQAWIDRLTPGSDDLEAGIEELHSLLLRGARFEVGRRRATLPHLSGGDLDDLAQQSADDALLAVLRKLPEFRGESRFTTWAYKFALLDAAARARSRAWQGREIPTELDSWSPSPACASTAQESLEMKELLAALKVAMASDLSAHQRKVLAAVALNDVPIDVLADRLGRSRGAIYKTIHDARQKLRAGLAARGINLSDTPYGMSDGAPAPGGMPRAGGPSRSRQSPKRAPASSLASHHL